jgi:hypothetical protein
VAGAGVSDQRLDNAHWRERFLGHPDEFGEMTGGQQVAQLPVQWRGRGVSGANQ